MHIVLLRGLAREAAHWMQFPQQLHNTIGDECVIHCIDFPGCGVHHREQALTHISTMTDFARTQLAAKNICERIIVIGISMGGMVALDWAQRFPAQLGGLIIINSSSGDQPIHWRLRAGAWLPMIAALTLPMRQREHMVLKHVSNQRENFAGNFQYWLDIQQQRPVSRRTILTMLMAAAKFRPQSTCTTRGLVIASEGDRFVSSNASVALAHRFQWPLALHKTAGHDIPLDEPEWLCTTIAHWLHPNGIR